VKKSIELKITRIGNSRGVRLPATLLRRYQIEGAVILEERADEIALRPKKQKKLSWEETAKAMAAANEDWSEWDAVVADGLNEL
jgi:antitoxin MazE